jgi:hypothetical protein
MDPVRPEQMSDDALGREIAAALNIEPSPAFAARVRQRIAEEAIPARWWVSWSIRAAAALAIAVAAAVALPFDWSWSRTDVMRHDQPPRQSALIESRVLAQPSELQSDRRSRAMAANGERAGKSFSGHRASVDSPVVQRSSLVPGSSVVSGLGRTEPEILIDVREANALRALFAGASLGTVDLIPLASAAGKAASELTPPVEIVIAPLINEPLTPMPGEGARP